MKPSLREQNISKIKELRSEVQWAGESWVNECFRLNIQFRISEAYRPQSRQDELWLIGRRGKKGESPVTYTKTSNHTQRLAVDVYPINCTYQDIEQVAEDYGITHPFTKGFVDLPHFEFTQVKQKPETSIFQSSTQWSQEAEMKAFARGILRLDEKTKHRAGERFLKRYGVTWDSVL